MNNVVVSDVAQQVWEGNWLQGGLPIQRPGEGDQTQEKTCGGSIIRLQNEGSD